MDSYKVHSGSAINWTTAFDLVQEYVNNNMLKRLLKTAKSFGLVGTGVVSSLVDATTMSVSAGTCIMANGEMVTIPTTSLKAKDLNLSANQTYVLVLNYKQVASEPVSAINGFYYNPDGSPYTTKYSKYLDSYEFTIKVSSGATYTSNQMPVCRFKADSEGLFDTEYALVDLRTEFKLVDQIVDDENILFKNKDYNIAQNWRLNKLTTPILSISDKLKISTSWDVITIQPENAERILKIKDLNGFELYSLDTDTGNVDFTIDTTTNPNSKFTFNGDLKVNGVLKVGNREVMLNALNNTPPPAPLNFRILDIKSSIPNGAHMRVTDKVDVIFAWNYDNLTGSGAGLAAGEFNVDSTEATVFTNSANTFEDYYFYLSTPTHVGKNYLIVNSEATTNGKIKIKVQDIDTGTYPDLTGEVVSANTSSRANINSNVKEYRLIKYLIENNVVVDTETEEFIVNKNGVFSIQMHKGSFIPEKTYKFELKAIADNLQTSTSVLEGGSFVKYGVLNYYGNPTVLTHPILPATSDKLTLVSSGQNVIVTITGFTGADYIDYVLGDSTQFDNGTAKGGTQTSRSFTIPASSPSGAFILSVRPKIGTQAVGVPISAVVNMGGSTVITNDVPLFTIPIMHNTIQCTVTKVSETEVSISALKSPANTAIAVTYLPSPLIGDILRVGTEEYIIKTCMATSTSGTYALTVSKATSTTANLPSGATTNCLIGTGSIRSRLIQNTSVNSKLEITKLAFDLDSIHLLPKAVSGSDYVNIRVFASNNTSEANIRNIQIRDGVDDITVANFNSNKLVIDGTNSDVQLSVDLYDSSDPSFADVNLQGVFGTLFVYGKYSNNGVGTTPIAQEFTNYATT